MFYTFSLVIVTETRNYEFATLLLEKLKIKFRDDYFELRVEETKAGDNFVIWIESNLNQKEAKKFVFQNDKFEQCSI